VFRGTRIREAVRHQDKSIALLCILRTRAAFDHAGALVTLVALIALSAVVDLVSQAARRSLR
jgi:hypothetical protein